MQFVVELEGTTPVFGHIEIATLGGCQGKVDVFIGRVCFKLGDSLDMFWA